MKINHPRRGTAKGCIIHPSGYMTERIDGKRLYQHRYVMEQHIGRELKKDEVVHHKDGNRLNNDISNLELMTAKEHGIHHAKILNTSEKGLKGANARWRKE
jgi:hypothetical protein